MRINKYKYKKQKSRRAGGGKKKGAGGGPPASKASPAVRSGEAIKGKEECGMLLSNGLVFGKWLLICTGC